MAEMIANFMEAEKAVDGGAKSKSHRKVLLLVLMGISTLMSIPPTPFLQVLLILIVLIGMRTLMLVPPTPFSFGAMETPRQQLSAGSVNLRCRRGPWGVHGLAWVPTEGLWTSMRLSGLRAQRS